jgi:hypothetical protein
MYYYQTRRNPGLLSSNMELLNISLVVIISHKFRNLEIFIGGINLHFCIQRKSASSSGQSETLLLAISQYR